MTGSLRRLTATRYATPLREGGSLPAVMEADDGQLYVVKFRGAGQGPRALLAEIVVGQLGRALGLRVPELVFVDVAEPIARGEPDPEIQALLTASVGLNVGMAFLAGALGFDPAARMKVDGALASRIVALDAFAMNVDRTARNPNMLWWSDELWLIDHGAAMYWQHDWDGSTAGSDRPFRPVRDHVLLAVADDLQGAGAELQRTLTDELLERTLAEVPDDWLLSTDDPRPPEARRRAYRDHLRARREATALFIEEAVRARASLV